MQKRLVVLIFLLTLLTAMAGTSEAFGQKLNKRPASKVAGSGMLSVTGFYCFSASGSHFGEVCLKTKNGRMCFGTDPGTRRIGFGQSSRGYKYGAQWRVVYSDESEHEMGRVASKITFTGRVVPTEECKPN